jgi:hypothetical protein
MSDEQHLPAPTITTVLVHHMERQMSTKVPNTASALDCVRRFRKRHFFRVFTAVGILVAAMAYIPSANAHSPNSGDHTRHAHRIKFDGRWSVVIETKRGTCDSYRIGLDIVGGTVTYAGSSYGRVSAAGVVRVSGAMGNQQAQGSGHLSRTSGRGVWRALINSGTCDGSWMAERHE